MNVDALTGPQARLLLNYLDNTRAAIELDPADYAKFWTAKYRLIGIEVADEIAQEQAA